MTKGKGILGKLGIGKTSGSKSPEVTKPSETESSTPETVNNGPEETPKEDEVQVTLPQPEVKQPEKVAELTTGTLVATASAPYHKAGTPLTVPEHTAKKMLAQGWAEYK